MDKSHIIDLKGKQFVTYVGLLDLAHQKGLAGFTTELLQAPNDANGQTTIVLARAIFDDGARMFCGIGDANPNNVNRMIAVHAIRMAETRAKGRALRDALNISMTMLEELDGSPEVGSPSKPVAKAEPAPPPVADMDHAKGQKRLRQVVGDVAKANRLTPDEASAAVKSVIAAKYGVGSSKDLTGKQIWELASDIEASPEIITQAADDAIPAFEP